MDHAVDSRYAWTGLAIALVGMTVGSGAMLVVAAVLPGVQAAFGIARADGSLPYALLRVGFGGVLRGRPADRRDVVVPLFVGAALAGGARQQQREPAVALA